MVALTEGEAMSIQVVKDQLVRLLGDADCKVIALTGKWGTGKSYMWNQVREDMADDVVKNALYVSLFGLSSLDGIKLKIVQSALPYAKNNPAVWESVRVGVHATKKILTSIHKGFSALDELALLAVPNILKNKLIVLDDVERKHKKLDIDEVLGFIDEFTQQHGARFMLILNSDQLNERDSWNTLHEKVIDQEIRLSTSSLESFDIAKILTASIYSHKIYNAVEACGLTNIRIIRKIIKTLNRILEGHDGLADSVLNRVVPSIVLLSAIHYKGIEDGPTLEFVLEQGTSLDWGRKLQENEVETEDSKRRGRWKSLIGRLGIVACDEFELLVVEFLQSGLFDSSSVSAVIDKYKREEAALETRNDCGKFFERAFWDHLTSEEDLLGTAQDLAARAHYLDAHWASTLSKTVANIPGGEHIADAVIDAWLAGFREKQLASVDFDDPFERELHPRIKTEFEEINAHAQASTSLYDACIYLATHDSWGPRQAIVLKSATTQDMQKIIKEKSSTELRKFMLKMMDLCESKDSYEPHFGSAMDRFVEACRDIVNDPDVHGRLNEIIRRVFRNSNMEAELDVLRSRQ